MTLRLDSYFWSATTSITTVGLLIVTAAYAWLTYKMMKAMQKQSWEESRPRMLVCVRAGQDGQFLVVHVENVGVSSAYSLKLSIDRLVHSNSGNQQAINNTPMFATGLRCMPPQTPSRYGLGMAFRYLALEANRELFPVSFEVTVTYLHQGQVISEVFPIDLYEQYAASLAEKNHSEEFGRNFPGIFKKSLGELTSAVEELRRADPETTDIEQGA